MPIGIITVILLVVIVLLVGRLQRMRIRIKDTISDRATFLQSSKNQNLLQESVEPHDGTMILSQEVQDFLNRDIDDLIRENVSVTIHEVQPFHINFQSDLADKMIAEIQERADEEVKDAFTGVVDYQHYLQKGESIVKLNYRLEKSFSSYMDLIGAILVDSHLHGISYINVVKGHLMDSNKLFRVILKGVDTELQSQIRIGKDFEGKKEIEEAENIYLDLIDDYCKRSEPYDRVCKMYRKQKDFENEMTIIQRYLEINPKSKTFKDRKKEVKALMKNQRMG